MNIASAPPGTLNTFDAFIFTCKAAVAAIFSVVSCWILDLPWGVWATVSALIIIQPSLHPSLRAIIVRVLANLIAAVAGGVLHAWIGLPLVDLVLGLLAVGMICHYAKLEDGVRSGFIAVAIVTQTMENSSTASAVDRVIAVGIGCLCAVVVHVLFNLLPPVRPRQPDPAGEKAGH